MERQLLTLEFEKSRAEGSLFQLLFFNFASEKKLIIFKWRAQFDY